MASGKSLERSEPHMVTVHYNNGQPLRREHSKKRMSKKERLRQRRINREANVLLNKQAYGFHTAKKEEI